MVELPSAEFARGRVVANCQQSRCGRRHRHEGSQRPVQAVWHGPWDAHSHTIMTSGAPQPSAAQRLATFPRCAVQQQRRRRPQLVRPGAPSPHDPRRHARRDSGVLRPRGGRAPASLVAMLREASPQKPTGPWSKICTAWFNSLVHRARPYLQSDLRIIAMKNSRCDFIMIG